MKARQMNWTCFFLKVQHAQAHPCQNRTETIRMTWINVKHSLPTPHQLRLQSVQKGEGGCRITMKPKRNWIKIVGLSIKERPNKTFRIAISARASTPLLVLWNNSLRNTLKISVIENRKFETINYWISSSVSNKLFVLWSGQFFSIFTIYRL